MRVLDTSGTVHTGRTVGGIARRLYGRAVDVVPVEVRTGVVHRWEVYRDADYWAEINGGTGAPTGRQDYVTDLYPTDED